MGMAEHTTESPLLGAYVSRRCPVAAQLQLDTSLQVAESEPTEADRARATAGISFEALIFDKITSLHGAAVAVVPNGDRSEMQAATASAMASSASIVLGGWLPDDLVARRAGRPDLLLRDSGGWLPIDVKHHKVVGDAELGAERCSTLSNPSPSEAFRASGVRPLTNALGDVLQLAHYWRLLKAAGLAARIPTGGIISRDQSLWWFDLTERRWTRGSLSGLEIYDREFRLRTEVIARQIRRNSDPTVPRMVIPLRKAECKSCGWKKVCDSEMEDADSVSLLAGLSWPNALRLIGRSIGTRTSLAKLDWDTAWVMHGDSAAATKVDLADVILMADLKNRTTSLRQLLGAKRRIRLARLEQIGLLTVGDLDRVDRSTANLSGLKVGYLPGLIDQARAAIAGEPFLSRGVTELLVPRADVEVDVDMENCEGGVYLWGALVNESGPDDSVPTYEAFVDWRPLTPEREAELFGRFFAWLLDLRDKTIASGRTFSAYCYSSAENVQMRRIAGGPASHPARDDAELFIQGPQWVDLYQVIRAQLVTGGAFGLKQIAPFAGFHWRDESPGGDESMIWYQRAVHDPSLDEREASQTRLLAYNEDDVRATAAIREWLSVTPFPSIEDVPTQARISRTG